MTECSFNHDLASHWRLIRCAHMGDAMVEHIESKIDDDVWLTIFRCDQILLDEKDRGSLTRDLEDAEAAWEHFERRLREFA